MEIGFYCNMYIPFSIVDENGEVLHERRYTLLEGTFQEIKDIEEHLNILKEYYKEKHNCDLIVKPIEINLTLGKKNMSLCFKREK